MTLTEAQLITEELVKIMSFGAGTLTGLAFVLASNMRWL